MEAKQKTWFQKFRQQRAIQAFVWAGMIYLVIFNLIPMFGLIMGFKDYNISSGIRGIFTSEWVGLKYFKEFVTDYKFGRLVRNTVALSVLKIIFSFPLPIIFALMVNEIHNLKFKKVLQTCSYLPHFISWVIISNIAYQFFSQAGIINTLLQTLHITGGPVGFLTDPGKFWGLAVFLDVWKEMGWWTIIFLAAITGISNDYYEAAQIDGASRMQRIWYITLPCIKPMIVMMFVLNVGLSFAAGYDSILLLYMPSTYNVADTVYTYTYRMAFGGGGNNYGLSAASGLFQSIVSTVLLVGSNTLSRKLGDGNSLF